MCRSGSACIPLFESTAAMEDASGSLCAMCGTSSSRWLFGDPLLIPRVHFVIPPNSDSFPLSFRRISCHPTSISVGIASVVGGDDGRKTKDIRLG
ncbi:hypothetical protein BLNAU_7319 [Blattamonas nauphoetae]|uniref:Uncharacterized protein n=1 Tax=Blattamonas nauphoetae TaxID=2049346 RepID=A0ABQ9Y1U2_9EUKA|nr:hypothetical protein BLNAU_7319 [Blattamonas nauphoetae]